MAIRRHDRQQVALKQIRRHPLVRNNDNEEFELYQHEIDVMKTLSSSSSSSSSDASNGHHICQLYDQHEDSNHYYVVMELCGQSDLFEYLCANGALSEQTTVRYMKQLLDAVHHIHSHNIIHGDLKLENVMIDVTTETLKIVDFGNSVSSTTTSTTERHNNNNKSSSCCGTSGTLAYMPPEMHIEENPHPTTAVDMYALGVIMYICLTGEHPFDPTGDATDQEIAINIVESSKHSEYLQDVVFDHDRIDFLSSIAIDLLQKLLHPDPQQRMTLDQFQNHPWMNYSSNHEVSGEQRCASPASQENEGYDVMLTSMSA